MIKLNLPVQTLQRLRELFDAQENYDFLGFTLDIETGILSDKLGSNHWEDQAKKFLIPAMLYHYSLGNPAPLTGKLVKFKDVPDGYAYEGAFIRRAIQPIEKVFGGKPDELPKAAKQLGGFQLNVGDASAEITALKGIPLTYIL